MFCSLTGRPPRIAVSPDRQFWRDTAPPGGHSYRSCRLMNMCAVDEKSALQIPTALHLAARYGLSELTTRLLDLPDARYASNLANCDDQYPEDLARRSQSSSLAAVLEDFREVVSRIFIRSFCKPSSPVKVEQPLRKRCVFLLAVVHLVTPAGKSSSGSMESQPNPATSFRFITDECITQYHNITNKVLVALTLLLYKPTTIVHVKSYLSVTRHKS